ncbi:MAG: PAS domain S-box protein [Rhodospirillales bacterium]|nr:PAS domain S-box protein [Alphaproteobacteria bacterium]USO05673.1 MAG: PAS domain S-box protein [Rhodospirillales bacterium]
MKYFFETHLQRTEEINHAYLDFSKHYVDTFEFMVQGHKGEDEETVYELSQGYVDGVHRLVKDFDTLAENAGSDENTVYYNELKHRIRAYRDVIIAAIQHASIDLDMAYEILLKANAHYNAINENFDKLLGKSFKDSSSFFTKLENTFEESLIQSVVIGLFFLLLTFIIILLLSRSITKPILNLTGNIRQITAEKDYDLRVLKETNDELGELADSFNLMLGTVTDAQNSLQKEKAFLSAVLDNMMQGVITIDKTGVIKTFNRWAEKTFGYKAEESVGRNVKTLMPEPYRSAHDGYLENYLKTREAKVIGIGREVEGQTKSGAKFPMSLSVTELEIDDERIFVGLAADISEQKDRERNLKHAKRMADQANKAKSEFLANMSHELRTPLNSIMGMTRMFTEDADLSEDNRSMAQTVLKSATNLLEIVNDILDISKIEAGSMVLEKTGFDLKDMVANVMEAMAPVASTKGIALSYSFSGEDIPYLVGDSFRLSRVLTNLISNAVKYTDMGEVDITIDSKTLGNNRIEIDCKIKDTGIGIAEDKLKVIFEKFTQADETITRKYGGTGLGLAITKELVKIMGGEIDVESEVGKGSVFWFKIPFKITDSIDQDKQDRVRQKRRKRKEERVLLSAEKARLLVAEDHLLNQEFIQRLLKRMGITHFDVVENGALALETYEKNSSYDMILMDCHMPELNGYDATRAIRKLEEGTDKRIPIIALTADAMKGTREKCLESGMDEYITKPIDSNEFKEILAQWIALPDKKGSQGSGGNKDNEKIGDEEEKTETPVNMEFLEEYADTPEEIKEFIQVYIEQSDESLDALEKHCVEGESRDWMETAHKLKGGAGMVGAQVLRDLCAEAQNMLDATKEAREDILKQIKDEYQKVKQYLEKATV